MSTRLASTANTSLRPGGATVNAELLVKVVTLMPHLRDRTYGGRVKSLEVV